MTTRAALRPPSLIAAVALVSLQGATLCVLALLEALALTSGRVTMGITASVFFVLLGAGLLACALGLYRAGSWARSPVVFGQLLCLGLAWSFRSSNPELALTLALVGVATLVGLFHPASIEALSDDPGGDPT